MDQLIAEARAGRLGQAEPPRSVVGTIDLPDDRALAAGRDAVLGLFAESLERPIYVHEDTPGYRASKRVTGKKTKRRG